MRTEKIGSLNVRLFDDISELPIWRFQLYCKYALYDSGIGADIEAVSNHLRRTVVLVRNDPNKAVTELENMQMSVSMILNGVNPSNMAFACFVAEVNGKPFTDLSEDGIKRLLEKFKHEKQSVIDRVFQSIKKKIQEDMETFFPENVDKSKEVEMNIIIRDRTVKELDRIITICDKRLSGKMLDDMTDIQREIDMLTARLIIKDAPPVFSGTRAVDIKFVKEFESMCTGITRFLDGQSAKDLSTLTFYQTIDDMDKEVKRAKRSRKRR